MTTDEKNRARFSSFFRSEYKKLVNYVRQRISSSYLTAEPEDIVQDVFLRLYKNIDSLKDSSKFESWVYQIARNAIIFMVSVFCFVSITPAHPMNPNT